MTWLLTLSYVAHVVAGGLWTGSVAYAAVTVVPAAREGDLAAAAFGRSVDWLLQTTRWTGVILPLTGGYQIWELYPLARLLGTTRGHLILGMLALWGVMNGILELGIYRLRAADGTAMGFARHAITRFGLDDDAEARRLAGVVRPYVLVATVLGVLLLVDAALLASGVVP
ncbi:copper resistance protein CopD [Halobaculum limi]|uniref:copper resistance protein CopD n=1 Tax=Halobaculum limi TaxID=3031916 RepID=UPI002404AF03|nr:copper resistance protein CopD [Halobaculum sp. YSMS11]